MTKDVIIFDTEFTSWKGSVARRWAGPSEWKEIVQIGAVRLRAADLVETASFTILVKPKLNPVLSDYFCKLTRITNEAVAQGGKDLNAAVEEFLSFVGGRPMFCYGRDDQIIAENLMLRAEPDAWRAAPATNLRTWLERVGVPLSGVHAGEVAAHVGAVAQGIAHNALVDARSLAEAARYLVKKGAPNPFLENGNVQ